VKKHLHLYSLLLICVLLLSDCKDKKVRPKNILPKQEFVRILADVHLTDAWMEKKEILSDSLAPLCKANFNQILLNYHTDRKTFDATYRFYIQNPDDFDLVYLDVINRLSQMQADATK